MRQKDRRKTENIKFCWRRQRQPQHTFGGKQRGSRAEDYFIWLVVWNVLDVLLHFLSTIIWVFFVSTKVRFIQYLTHLKPPARRWNPYILGPRFSCPKVSVSVHPACLDPWKCKKKNSAPWHWIRHVGRLWRTLDLTCSEELHEKTK